MLATSFFRIPYCTFFLYVSFFFFFFILFFISKLSYRIITHIILFFFSSLNLSTAIILSLLFWNNCLKCQYCGFMLRCLNTLHQLILHRISFFLFISFRFYFRPFYSLPLHFFFFISNFIFFSFTFFSLSRARSVILEHRLRSETHR